MGEEIDRELYISLFQMERNIAVGDDSAAPERPFEVDRLEPLG